MKGKKIVGFYQKTDKKNANIVHFVLSFVRFVPIFKTSYGFF